MNKAKNWKQKPINTHNKYKKLKTLLIFWKIKLICYQKENKKSKVFKLKIKRIY